MSDWSGGDGTSEEVGAPGSVVSPFRLRPLGLEWVALTGAFVALVALALIRVGMTDTPYHLATARLAHETGSWPTTNTFSYTFPDYPLYQQYPVYQELLYQVHQRLGWEGLSVLHFVSYLAIFVLWLIWWGGLRWACVLSLPAMLLVLGLRERMVLRPDILTMGYFVLSLLLIDRVRRGSVWPLLALPVVQLLWVNSHQMFWLGLAIQFAFVVHLLAVRLAKGRFGISQDDRDVGLRPVLCAVGVSVVACFLSPIGTRIIEVPLQTMGSLYSHREHVMEFRPFYESGQALWLVATSGMLGVCGLWLGRKRILPFEWIVWCLGGVMVAGAIRGAPYFIAISLGIFARELRATLKSSGLAETVGTGHAYFLPRAVGALLAIALALEVYWFRWVEPSRILGGSQFGVGRTLGNWPDETMAFLRVNPPPGPLMNLGWYIGNPIVLDLYPKHRVFVDPRFEAYPRGFLLDAIASEKDPLVLERLIDHYKPLWLVCEIRIRGVRQQVGRLLSLEDWTPVFLDPVCVVLVRRSPETEVYLRVHEIDLSSYSPRGFLVDEPDLCALQRVAVASLLAEVGKQDRASEFLEEAVLGGGTYPAVGSAVATLLAEHPELALGSRVFGERRE